MPEPLEKYPLYFAISGVMNTLAGANPFGHHFVAIASWDGPDKPFILTKVYGFYGEPDENAKGLAKLIKEGLGLNTPLMHSYGRLKNEQRYLSLAQGIEGHVFQVSKQGYDAINSEIEDSLKKENEARIAHKNHLYLAPIEQILADIHTIEEQLKATNPTKLNKDNIRALQEKLVEAAVNLQIRAEELAKTSQNDHSVNRFAFIKRRAIERNVDHGISPFQFAKNGNQPLFGNKTKLISAISVIDLCYSLILNPLLYCFDLSDAHPIAPMVQRLLFITLSALCAYKAYQLPIVSYTQKDKALQGLANISKKQLALLIAPLLYMGASTSTVIIAIAPLFLGRAIGQIKLGNFSEITSLFEYLKLNLTGSYVCKSRALDIIALGIGKDKADELRKESKYVPKKTEGLTALVLSTIGEMDYYAPKHCYSATGKRIAVHALLPPEHVHWLDDENKQRYRQYFNLANITRAHFTKLAPKLIAAKQLLMNVHGVAITNKKNEVVPAGFSEKMNALFTIIDQYIYSFNAIYSDNYGTAKKHIAQIELMITALYDVSKAWHCLDKSNTTIGGTNKNNPAVYQALKRLGRKRSALASKKLVSLLAPVVQMFSEKKTKDTLFNRCVALFQPSKLPPSPLENEHAPTFSA